MITTSCLAGAAASIAWAGGRGSAAGEPERKRIPGARYGTRGNAQVLPGMQHCGIMASQISQPVRLPAMENVLFYVFSTIAATFGSAVGLIVAAAIFRLQKIDQVCMALANALMTDHQDQAEKHRLARIIMVQDWGKYLSVWGGCHTAPRQGQSPAEADYKWLLEKTVKRLKWIRRWVYTLVLGTLVLMAFCFCCLVNAGRIAKGIASDGPFPWQGQVAVAVALLVLVGYIIVTSLLVEQPVDYEDRPEGAV